jgi:hypothetical protein
MAKRYHKNRKILDNMNSGKRGYCMQVENVVARQVTLQ